MTGELHTTTEYGRFTSLEGNRSVSRSHVNELKRLIQKNGNLTEKFPIKVNPSGDVLDGQHRLQALKELKQPVTYEVVRDVDIDGVRAINLGNRNWTWKDMAESHYKLGNEEYGWFLQYVDDYQLPFQVAQSFCDVPVSRGHDSSFNQGNLLVEDKDLAIERAVRYRELLDMTNIIQRDFALAFRLISLNKDYDHSRMVKKLAERSDTLPLKATRLDYARALEEIYNYNMGESNRVRLF